MFQVFLPVTQEKSHQALIGAQNENDETKNNFGESHKELLWWHYRFGNILFAHLMWIERQNKLSFKNYTYADNFYKVVCAAYEFGKASKIPDGYTNTNPM